jgi:hypothetical protein
MVGRKTKKSHLDKKEENEKEKKNAHLIFRFQISLLNLSSNPKVRCIGTHIQRSREKK